MLNAVSGKNLCSIQPILSRPIAKKPPLQKKDSFNLLFCGAKALSETELILAKYPHVLSLAQASASVIQVRDSRSSKRRVLGTGFWLKVGNEWRFITAAHLIRQADVSFFMDWGINSQGFMHFKNKAPKEGEQWYQFSLQLTEPADGDWNRLFQNDVLIFKPDPDFHTHQYLNQLSLEPPQFRNLRDEPLKVGEQAILIGHSPRRTSNALSHIIEVGNITEINIDCPPNLPGKSAKYFRVSLEHFPGDSGSLIVDQQGRLIGILAGGNKTGTSGAAVQVDDKVQEILTR